MLVEAVVFDLDGTITKPFFDFDMIRRQMGLTDKDGPVWEAMAKMNPEQRKYAEAILEHYEQQAVEQSQLNDGVGKTLSVLEKRGIRTAILTRNKAANAIAVAEKHNLRFDYIIGREDGPVKPDAYGLLELCRRFAVEPDNVLVVGDYLFDLQCAKQAGAVAILLANHPQADEFAPYADFVIDRIDEILTIIDGEK